MRDVLGETLKSLKQIKRKRRRMVAILLVLSLIVSLDVFWTLRQPGLTLAGDADCGIVEHTHDSDCGENCTATEHVHSIFCYSDEQEGVENQLDWQNLFHDYPFTGDLRQDLVGIAKTQVGYTESKLNFEVRANGSRQGYTRYGAWYGTPYGDWSAMFVSFCLHYAGADKNAYPINIGAASMSELWKRAGKYAPMGQYNPVSGDLVFFKDNTVGIIAETYNATMYVIRGDMEDAVQGGILPLTDVTIAGWGVTGSRIPAEPAIKPVVQIFTTPQPVMRRYSLRNTRAVIDLLAYLQANGGDCYYTLLDKNNQELPKDENGHYVVIAATGYKLTVSFASPEGFLPGTYQYQIPQGLLVDGGEGLFVLQDGTNVGTWAVSDSGLITLTFNENINTQTDITISATMGIHFAEQEDPIDFDGKIMVTVQKPPAEAQTTKVSKWGIQGGEDVAGKTDSTKIFWNASIVGMKDSTIPGCTVTDRVMGGDWLGEHHYTQSDMDAGLRFGASDPSYGWHAWTVYPGDPNLTWTETGWTYIMPEKITCQWCGEVELGNEGWIYYIDYSSTPDTAGYAGTLYYMNTFMADNQYTEGGASFSHGEALGEVFKDGSFIADASGGAFYWEVEAVIPAIKQGQKADYHWYLMDYLYLVSDGYLAGYMENDAHLARVMATYNGTTVSVPRIQDATDGDLFAWENAWTASSNGINYGREINLLSRCTCTAETCRFWNNGCQEYWYQRDDGTWATNGFCQCWTPTDTVKFTFVYKTEDLSIVEKYGGLGYQLMNVAELYYKPNGGSEGTLVSNEQASVTVPGLFQKTLSQDFDGYTAHYRVTVNEAKLVLTDGSPLTIHDAMTKTLAYISGSLVITAEDQNGNLTTLKQDVDYTVNYDGTGNQTDQQGNEVHVLDIEILHPQPVMYILDYDTTLIMPNQVTGGVKYSNSATISLWGQSFTESSVEKVYADINIAAKTYKVKLNKTCATTGKPLSGATFGLYNAQGGLIASAVTNKNGELQFQSNIIEGIVLREHVLYYMQEIAAPSGYLLDDTKYWFCFCNERDNSCDVYKDILEDIEALRIPYEQIGVLYATNEMIQYDLPATGGAGVYPLILVSVAFIVTPLVYRFIQRRKRGRRGVG